MIGLLWDFGVLLVYGFAMMHLGRWYFARRAAERERRALQRAAQRWGQAQGVR
ncbi:MAG: hypothetical protein MUF01_02390 [Bryobacterales bacterium]|jgi:hypothetical protein|nr:hypothetical protein [Bryobacterales bacterium]